jgi:hypothetical protein
MVLVIAAVSAVVVIQTGRRDAGTPPPAPTPTAVAAAPSNSAAGVSPSAAAAPVTTEAGGPLLGVTAGWELFGLTRTGMVRVELARGRVTRTDLAPPQDSAPTSFVVGRDWAMMRPWDASSGYLVPDGRPATTLAGPRYGPILPGPDPATVWAMGGDTSPAMIPMDTAGRPAGAPVALPQEVLGSVLPDGTGYLTFSGTGGVYSARPGALRRITTGELLAAGPTRWLTLECDDRYRCGPVVIDRRTGARHPIDVSVDGANAAGGLISPNGRTAALVVSVLGGTSAVDLIDLASGAASWRVSVSVGSAPSSVMAWSPDSRWLFVVGSNDWLYPVDATTGVVHDLGVELPGITQVAVRPAPAS